MKKYILSILFLFTFYFSNNLICEPYSVSGIVNRTNSRNDLTRILISGKINSNSDQKLYILKKDFSLESLSGLNNSEHINSLIRVADSPGVSDGVPDLLVETGKVFVNEGGLFNSFSYSANSSYYNPKYNSSLGLSFGIPGFSSIVSYHQGTYTDVSTSSLNQWKYLNPFASIWTGQFANDIPTSEGSIAVSRCRFNSDLQDDYLVGTSELFYSGNYTSGFFERQSFTPRISTPLFEYSSTDKIMFPIINWDGQYGAFYIGCIDVDSDGLDDLVSQVHSTNDKFGFNIHFNNGNGTFTNSNQLYSEISNINFKNIREIGLFKVGQDHNPHIMVITQENNNLLSFRLYRSSFISGGYSWVNTYEGELNSANEIRASFHYIDADGDNDSDIIITDYGPNDETLLIWNELDTLNELNLDDRKIPLTNAFRVYEYDSSALSGAKVVLGENEAMVSPNGNFKLFGVEEGVYSPKVVHPLYGINSSQEPLIINSDVTNVQLLASLATPTPSPTPTTTSTPLVTPTITSNSGNGSTNNSEVINGQIKTTFKSNSKSANILIEYTGKSPNSACVFKTSATTIKGSKTRKTLVATFPFGNGKIRKTIKKIGLVNIPKKTKLVLSTQLDCKSALPSGSSIREINKASISKSPKGLPIQSWINKLKRALVKA
jgi:hypothetical protein